MFGPLLKVSELCPLKLIYIHCIITYLLLYVKLEKKGKKGTYKGVREDLSNVPIQSFCFIM